MYMGIWDAMCGYTCACASAAGAPVACMQAGCMHCACAGAAKAGAERALQQTNTLACTWINVCAHIQIIRFVINHLAKLQAPCVQVHSSVLVHLLHLCLRWGQPQRPPNWAYARTRGDHKRRGNMCRLPHTRTQAHVYKRGCKKHQHTHTHARPHAQLLHPHVPTPRCIYLRGCVTKKVLIA